MYAETEVYDLRALMGLVKEGISELFPGTVWVRAELAALQVKGGNCYMELCQSDGVRTVAKARAIAWSGVWGFLSAFFRSETGSDLAPGMKVLLRVSLNFSEQYGLSLYVAEIDPAFTLGDAEARRRRTLEQLEAEGLLDAQKELALPLLPRSLAVISAGGAAGYGDFCKHLEGNLYGFTFRTVLFEAVMQGENAPASVCSALDRAEKAALSGEDSFDAVLILRGGGSALDLSCFDDCGLARRIASCGLPVLTAIGHERDLHVADVVACLHFKTPTALADFFIGCFSAEDGRISSLEARLKAAFSGKLAAMESALKAAAARISRAVAAKAGAESFRLDALEARIKAADPRAVLQRGYVLATDSRGVLARSAAPFSAGDGINIMFPDGTLACRVEEKR